MNARLIGAGSLALLLVSGSTSAHQNMSAIFGMEKRPNRAETEVAMKDMVLPAVTSLVFALVALPAVAQSPEPLAPQSRGNT